MVEISVLIPSKVGEHRLPAAIKSIYDKDLNIEILVGIDGSDSNLIKELNDLKIENLTVYEFNKDTGTTKILNELLLITQGEFIARMDADDLSLPKRLSTQINFMKENSDVSMICTNALGNSGTRMMKRARGFLDYKDFLNNNPVIHPTVMMRKSDLTEGNYSYNNKWIKSQDYELWTRISRRRKIYYDSEPLVQYTKTFNLKGFSKQYFYFKIAQIKNLFWHLFKNSSSSKLLAFRIFFVFLLMPIDYLKIVIWNRINAK